VDIYIQKSSVIFQVRSFNKFTSRD